MSRNRTGPLVLLGIVAMLSAACSAGAPSGTMTAPSGAASAASSAPSAGGTTVPGVGSGDGCALITVQEAASVTKVGVSAANGAGTGPSSGCLYMGDGGALVISSTLQVGIAGIEQYLNDPANEQVSGIGDKAVIFRASGFGVPTGRTIYARKGDKSFVLNVHVEGIDDAAAKTMLTDLATIAMGRI